MTGVKLEHLYISGGHCYFGRHGLDPLDYAMEEREEISCRKGRGVEGDRFFDYKPDYKGQITFFAGEIYDAMRAALRPGDCSPERMRRNVITRGLDLNACIGREFEIQGVRFLGHSECAPCYWMDQAFAPGAEAWLKGRGGLRAKILSSGWLKVDAPC